MALVVDDDTPTTLEDLKAISERIDERLASECADLRELLEVEQLLINEAEKILAHSNERAKRVRRALAALEGTSAQPQKPPQRQEGRKANEWQVSEERIAYVLTLWQAQAEPVTSTYLAESTGGISTETVSKATAVLRERELIRKVAKVRGGGWTYAVMPEVADAA